MAQHKVIDRLAAAQKKGAAAVAEKAKAAAEAAAEKARKQQNKAQRAASAAPVPTARQNQSRGSYYSPRQYGADSAPLNARAEAARKAMEEQAKALEQSRRAMEELYRQAREARESYHSLKGQFVGENAGQYEQKLLDQYTEATELYVEGKAEYDRVYGAYKPYEDAYNRAARELNDYLAAEEREYQAWRGTIRDAESIRAEQQELQQKRTELKRLMQMTQMPSGGYGAISQATGPARNELRIRELQDYLGGQGEREKLLLEELQYSEHFRYEDLRANPDFAQQSQYRSTGTAGQLQVDPMTGRTYDAGSYDRTYEFVNRNAQAVGAQAMNDVNNEMGHLQTMTDDEIALYNYLYATQGREAAAEYLGHLRLQLTARQQEGYNALIDEMVRSGGVPGAALASAGSLLLSPFAGLQTAFGQVGSALTGQEIDPNAGYAMVTNTKNALRQSVSQQVEAHAGPVGSFAYQTVMSMGDMLMDATVGGPGAMALIGTRAFSESVMDAKNRGLSNDEALKMGAVSALAEVMTERIGLDEMLHLPKDWEDAGFWKGLARGAGGEAAEEGLTNIVNLAADLTIAGENSEFARSIEQYKAEGKDDAAALEAALKDAGISLGLDVLGGALSGGAFGGYRGWLGKRAADVQQKQEKAPSVSEADSSPIPDGTGEPVETAGTVSRMETVETVSAQAVQENVQKETAAPDNGTKAPDNGTKAPDNGTKASDNGTVREDRTVGETVRREAQVGKTLDELRQTALNHRNPLLTGSLNDARQEEELRRIRNAQTRTEVTGIDYGATDEQVQEALRIGKLIGKEVLFAPKGQNYNAFYDRTSDEIHVAPDAENLLAAAVGHELTHSIERTGEWERLRDLVAARMTQTGVSMESARRERLEIYAAAGVALTDERAVDQEIVANFVEKNLLTDEQSIRDLVRDERSVARRILDWLDSLWARVAKTGKSQEREFVRKAREIYRSALAEAGERRAWQELRRAARDAYAEGDDETGDAALDAAMGEDLGGLLEDDFDSWDDSDIPFSVPENEKTARVGGEVKFSLRVFGDGRRFVDIQTDQDKFEGLDVAQKNKTAKTLIQKRFVGHVIGLENKVFVNGDSASEYVHPSKNIAPDIREAKMRAAPELDNLLDAGFNFRNAPDGADGHVHPNVTGGFDYFDVIFKVGDEYYQGVINIMNIKRGKLLKDVTKIRNITKDIISSYGENPKSEFLRDASMISIDGGTGNVNTKFSIREKDSEGRELTQKQQAYFAKSKVRDGNGNLKAVYHGSPSDFNEFSMKYLGLNGTSEGKGFYFTDDRNIAQSYANGTEAQRHQGADGRLYEVYLNIEKPLSSKRVSIPRAAFRKFIVAMSKQVDEDGEPLGFLDNYGDVAWEGLNNVVNSVMAVEYDGSDNDVNMIHSIINGCGERELVYEVLRKTTGYDGIIVEEATWGGDQTIYVAFHPDQIKNVDNEKPTDSKDIRYSVRENTGEEGGFTKGWHDDDEAARAAQMEGYPVINGVQVVPMKTFVLAQDFRKDKAGNVILDKQGNPIRNHNYGLVAGLGSKPGTLKINFHNKNVVNEETGETLRRDGVEIDIADLTPTPGVFQQTDEDFESLIGQAPEEETYYSDEEWAEIEALRNRATMEEAGGGRPENWESVTREDIMGMARERLQGGERQLARRVAGLMMVPGWARRDFLEPVVKGLIDTYLEQGTVDQGLRDELFNTAWEEGRVVEREFYDEYKEVKDYLRKTPIHVPQQIRESIGDFNRAAFGKLRARKDGRAGGDTGPGKNNQMVLEAFREGINLQNREAGTLSIEDAWSELQEMAPALFRDDILNEEERVRRMLDVAESIAIAEYNLDAYYSSDLEDAKAWSRNEFEVAVQDAIRTAWEVRRVALDQQADAAAVAGEDGEVLTVEEVTKLYPKLKDARRAVEKAMAKNLLNKQDKNQVQRLLRHDIQPEHLDPEVDNVRGILAVYEAKKAFEEVAKPIREWNRQRKARLYAEAEELVYEAEMAGGIQDKSKGILYSRETMERNIRDIVKNPEHADRIIDTYFRPVHQAEAAATRMKNRYRERVKALDISRKVRKGDQVSEAYAVQFYGEVSDILRLMEESNFRLKQRDGKSYNEWKAELQKLWEENPSLDKGKIENAAREMGKIYEELFTEMNKVRVENGYEPINHRSGYFPHFQQDGRDGILSQFGKAMGIDVEVQSLPTSINGMTHTFKPGIRWFGNALERKTFDTAYDAVEGFDRYIEGCASVVHQTANIQRLRALANQIRYRTGDEGLREQIRKIQEREDLTDEQKDTLIRETASEGKFQLSNFVVELDEYTNLLANKKSRADRNMEQAMGRDMYNIVKGLESRVAANMVAINPASWLTNFIPITQGWACLSGKHLLNGMWKTIRAIRTDDGMVDMSDFLTNRQGSDPLVKMWEKGTAPQSKLYAAKEKVMRVGDWIGGGMEVIDSFTAGCLVRARYAQNLSQGMSVSEAMSEADEWAAGVMADRSKGAMPTVFHRSNPLTKLFTQFQLEVNNQLSYMFKDIPREKRKKGVLAVALALMKLALGAWLYNELYEKHLGRRPALDPIDMAFGFGKDVMDPELDFADAAMNLGGKIAENTPFVGGLLGGGRVPISSALPDVGNLVKVVGDSDWSAGKKLAVAGKELAKPLTYMVLPFGGGQVKKIWEGIQMIRKDGSYTVDKDGRPLLQYPLYSTNDAVQKALEAGQAMAFGKTTIRSGRAWVEGGFKTLSADQTATYQALVNLGVEQADAFELMQELRGAEKTDKQSRAQVQRDILRASGLEGDALGIVYYDLLVDDGSKEKALMEALQKDGADMGAVASCLMDIKDADAMYKGAESSNAKRSAILGSGLEDKEKQDIYHDMISDDYDERIEKFRDAGMDMDDFLIAQNEYTRIKDSYEDEGDMATAFARWVNQQGYSASQKQVIRDCFKYWKMMPADADRYDRGIEAGLSDADAAELVEDLKAVTPLEGEDNVKQYQNWRVAIDNAVNEKNQLTLLKSVGMNDASYAKCEAAWGQGIAPAAYVRAKELESQFNEDGKGSLKNTEWTKLIDSMTTTGIVLAGDNTRFHLTNEQKGFLWQMLTGSKSTKNNPYSVKGGEKWLEIKEAMVEEKEE